jgi:hypothetical protein
MTSCCACLDLQLRQETALLERRLSAAQNDAKDAAAAAQTAALASEGALSQRDSAIHAYLEKSVLRLLQHHHQQDTGFESNRDTVLSLTRELCALKVVEAQLGTQLEAARLHTSSLTAANGSLRRAAQAAEVQARLSLGFMPPPDLFTSPKAYSRAISVI